MTSFFGIHRCYHTFSIKEQLVLIKKFCNGMKMHAVKLGLQQLKYFSCHSKRNNFIPVNKVNSITVTFVIQILHLQKSYKPKEELNVLVND